MESDIDRELALFEQEIASVEASNVNAKSTTNADVRSFNDVITGSSSDAFSESSSNEALISFKVISHNDKSETSSSPIRSSSINHIGPGNPVTLNSLGPPLGAPPDNMAPQMKPFIPHVLMNPAFVPHGMGGMRFMPPPLRMPIFGRPTPQMTSQPPVLESGPSMYEDVKKAADENSTNKESETVVEAGSTATFSNLTPSNVDPSPRKRCFDDSNKMNAGQEKKLKRFLRCGGGQVWEDRSLSEWDPNDFRIFCGDLGNEVSDELLAKAFRKYPSFQKAKVIREARTNKSKGYGFVSFKHQDDFVRACREMDGKYVGNRPIKLRKSNWRERNMDIVRKKKKQKERLGFV